MVELTQTQHIEETQEINSSPTIRPYSSRVSNSSSMRSLSNAPEMEGILTPRISLSRESLPSSSLSQISQLSLEEDEIETQVLTNMLAKSTDAPEMLGMSLAYHVPNTY